VMMTAPTSSHVVEAADSTAASTSDTVSED
jgi:hypothetical protein